MLIFMLELFISQQFYVRRNISKPSFSSQKEMADWVIGDSLANSHAFLLDFPLNKMKLILALAEIGFM